jgi:hypothetical protein
MSKVTVSLAGCDYDPTRALFDGRVQIKGCDVIPVAMSPEEAFHRAFRFQGSCPQLSTSRRYERDASCDLFGRRLP